MNTVPDNDEQVREAVRERYRRTALQVLGAGETTAEECCGGNGCCSNTVVSSTGSQLQASCCGAGDGTVISSDLYSSAELGELPLTAALASLGCGNPTALAELKPGERVLDLGSGGGIDVLLSARRVGPTGFVYGLDMTDQMLPLAQRNADEAGAGNGEVLQGPNEADSPSHPAGGVGIRHIGIKPSPDQATLNGQSARVPRP